MEYNKIDPVMEMIKGCGVWERRDDLWGSGLIG